MRNKTVLIFLLVVKVGLSQLSWSLDTAFTTNNASQVYADHLGNVYLVNNWTVEKHDENFTEKFIYNNPGLGNITYLNVFNPLKFLIYYQDFNQYLFLDNKLNQNLQAFLPSNQGYYDVQLAATTDNSNIWFYNQVSDKIYKWGLIEEKELNASLQISQLSGSDSRPNYLWANLKNVYLNIPDIGILVFDNFGSYKSTLPIAGLEEFFFSETSIVFKNGNDLEWFNDFTKTSIKRKLPQLVFDDLFFAEDKLYILTAGKLSIYKLR